MFNLRNIFSFFKRKDNLSTQYDPDFILCHIVFNKKTKTAHFCIDYENILGGMNAKNGSISNDDTQKTLLDSEQLANLLYSLCNVKDFLPSLIAEDLKNHQKDSDLHDLFISGTINYLDHILFQKKNNQHDQPFIRPSQVFKNGQ